MRRGVTRLAEEDVSERPLELDGGRSRRQRFSAHIVPQYQPRAFIIWHLLSDPEARYHDLGADFYDNRIGPERKNRTHVRQLEALGYKVTLEPAA